MTPQVRAAIAYIAACATGRTASAIYDYSQGQYRQFSGTVSSSVNVYDYSSSSHISGSRSRGTFNLYHYGEGSHISLEMQGMSFRGYDYGSSSHFTGSVNGGAVVMYDYSEGQHFNYQA